MPRPRTGSRAFRGCRSTCTRTATRTAYRQADCMPRRCMHRRSQSAIGDVQLADVDNYPFGWSDGTAPRAPRTSTATATASSTPGDAIRHRHHRQLGRQRADWTARAQPICFHGVTADCYDGLRNFNQVRPAVFDGGYAFGSPAGSTPELAAAAAPTSSRRCRRPATSCQGRGQERRLRRHLHPQPAAPAAGLRGRPASASRPELSL